MIAPRKKSKYKTIQTMYKYKLNANTHINYTKLFV